MPNIRLKSRVAHRLSILSYDWFGAVRFEAGHLLKYIRYSKAALAENACGFTRACLFKSANAAVA